jgi:hypothetical protein
VGQLPVIVARREQSRCSDMPQRAAVYHQPTSECRRACPSLRGAHLQPLRPGGRLVVLPRGDDVVGLQAGPSRGVRLGYTPTRRQVSGADRDRLRFPSALIDTTQATSKTSPGHVHREREVDERATRRVSTGQFARAKPSTPTRRHRSRSDVHRPALRQEHRPAAAERDAALRAC